MRDTLLHCNHHFDFWEIRPETWNSACISGPGVLNRIFDTFLFSSGRKGIAQANQPWVNLAFTKEEVLCEAFSACSRAFLLGPFSAWVVHIRRPYRQVE